MAELTSDQLAFLRKQGIGLSTVFDASGLRKRDYPELMEEAGAYFAFGVSACNAGGHSLRTRAGHCIQCDTSRIAYALRHSSQGNVYLAASRKVGLVKIGMTKNIKDRLNKINEYAYGGTSDWQLVCWSQVSEAGRVEAAIQSNLAGYQVAGQYTRAGRPQGCYELFNCAQALAEQTFAEAVASKGVVLRP